jgi:hypothetical protein
MRLLLVLLVASTLALAAAGQTPAPIEGEPADLDRFAGAWVGGYICEETGRHGTVLFRLAAGADTVEAAILMIPRATEGPQATAVPLAVHRVAVEGRTLRGVLARYDDPEWDLPLETDFVGTLADDGQTIKGTFRAVGTTVDTIPQNGRWWARRASESAALHVAPPRRLTDHPQP